MNSLLLTDHPPSPIQALDDALLTAKGVRLWVKRDDLLRVGENDAFCGNKWRKLQYNLLEAARLKQTTLLTFGGAYSNHLAAVAQAGQLFDFQTIGVLRGEMHVPLNPTLRFCIDCGMKIHYVERHAYRQKDNPLFLEKLRKDFGNFYLLPEGGTNDLAIKGCRTIVSEIAAQLSGLPDYIAVACGTGGTLAGIVQGIAGRAEAIGISVLKGDFLHDIVTQLLSCNPEHGNFKQKTTTTLKNWRMLSDYHFGGYAKFQAELIYFINQFKAKHDILLDPIYTGKLFFAIFDLIQKDYFPRDTTIVMIHTGGLQGIKGFNERFGNLID